MKPFIAKKPKNVFDGIWERFAENRKQNRAMAFANLQQDIARNASELVPNYMTAKELVTVVADIEQYTKSDQQSASGDPVTVVGDWLRGEIDLSRTQMDKIAKQRVQ